jgi:hypothetical protein
MGWSTSEQFAPVDSKVMLAVAPVLLTLKVRTLVAGVPGVMHTSVS